VLEAVLLATLVTHPVLIARFEADLENLHLLSPDHDLLRHSLLRHAHADPEDSAEEIILEAGPILESLFARSHVRSAPPVRNRKDPDLAVMCLAEGLAKLEARRSARQEIEDAMEDMTGLADEGLTWRLTKAAVALQGPQRSSLEDASDMGEDRSALSRGLQDMIDARIWIKKKG
jgi:DNA primase